VPAIGTRALSIWRTVPPGGYAPGMSNLSPRRTRFVNEFMVDMCSAAAARRAGYSERTADRQGSRLLRLAEVQAALRGKVEELERATQLTTERIERELAAVAFADPRRAFDAQGRLLNLPDMPDDVARAVSSFDVTVLRDDEGRETGTTTRVRMVDKTQALRLACQRRGLLLERLQVEAPPAVSITINGRVLSSSAEVAVEPLALPPATPG